MLSNPTACSHPPLFPPPTSLLTTILLAILLLVLLPINRPKHKWTSILPIKVHVLVLPKLAQTLITN